MADFEPHECPHRHKHRGDISACAWCEFDPLTDNPRLLDRPFGDIVTFNDWLRAKELRRLCAEVMAPHTQ